ncbi:MAG TPA: transglutaminase domain-containing protein [Chryseosolibacter sp.]|nr:transglutaminase domain-containing protein [Chryseosolibacter sp.]
MKALLAILFTLLPQFIFAQKDPFKFGDVSFDEVKMKVYDRDSSASAVVLFDFGTSQISYNQTTGFSLLFERKIRVKILTKDGLDQANFEIPVYSSGGSEEKIYNIKGITFNLENGKITESKLKNDGIFKEPFDDNYEIHKVTMPNVKEGSVIDLSYDLRSDFLFNFQDWEFQKTIPVVWSEYRARIPEFFNYEKYMQGYVALAINEHETTHNRLTITEKTRSTGKTASTTFNTENIDYKENAFRWAAQHVPAFKEEPFLTTYRDYISKINFELGYIKYPDQPIQPVMGSWEEMNKKFTDAETCGREITGNGFLKNIVEDVTAGATTQEEKISRILSYVKNHVAWDGRYRKYTGGSLKRVLDEQTGSSADINLLAASMIEKTGIPVKGVLISTRNHGFVRTTLPISSQFNYVACIATLDGKDIVLDATEKMLPHNVLPQRCLNGSGFAFSSEGYQWVNLETKFKSKTTAAAELSLSPSATLVGKIKIDHAGYSAMNQRKEYLRSGHDEYMKGVTKNRAWELEKSEIQNAENIENNFVELHDLTINQNVTEAGNLIYIDPFVAHGIKANPFKSERREYPVDYGNLSEQVFLLKLQVPENYTIDELPATKIFMLPGNAAKYVYSVTQANNIVSITSILSINRSLFTQEEYPNLREFYNQVVAKQAEQIVLKKN